MRPITPFLLLAAFAFARSSTTLHDWLPQHPALGRLIEDWYRDGSVDRRAKWLAFAVMTVGVPVRVVLLQLAIFIAVSVFLVPRPDTVTARR